MFVNCNRVGSCFLRGFCFALVYVFASCGAAEKYETLKDNFAGPIAIAAKDNTHFFVLNSDFDRTFNQGSLSVLDRDGNKLKTLFISRLGRGLRVYQNTLFIYFSNDEGVSSKIELYDITNPIEPTLIVKRDFEQVCDPNNLVLRADYDYFAVSCVNGDLYFGKIAGDQTTLKLVRRYAFPRRAMYLDKTNGLLYAFSTIDFNTRSFIDAKLTDKFSHPSGQEIPNEVPDEYESTTAAYENLSDGYAYQFVVYDIAEEEADGFPYKSHEQVQHELRWLYFNLKDENGKVDHELLANQNMYRTNFWDAVIDPQNPDSFLISHRDVISGQDSKSSNVLRVKVVASPKATKAGDNWTVPRTDSFFTFERVYGYKADLPQNPYPAALQASMIDGEPILLINHYRDKSRRIEKAKFSIVAKKIGAAPAFSELDGKPPFLSFYEMAMMPDGRTLAGSFYGNMVLLFDVPKTSDITNVNVKEIR